MIKTHHQQEVEGTTNDIKASVFQPEEMQVLAPQTSGLLWAGVGSSTAELSAAPRTPGTSPLQMSCAYFTCNCSSHWAYHSEETGCYHQTSDMSMYM